VAAPHLQFRAAAARDHDALEVAQPPQFALVLVHLAFTLSRSRRDPTQLHVGYRERERLLLRLWRCAASAHGSWRYSQRRSASSSSRRSTRRCSSSFPSASTPS